MTLATTQETMLIKKKSMELTLPKTGPNTE
jgi:hypothetical protein